MGEIEKLEHELTDLRNHLFALVSIRDEVWAYHPSNPNFINPIRLYENLNNNILDIERKINEVEFRLNSLN
jgi:hypothetical protein